jgi:hypothetical protein
MNRRVLILGVALSGAACRSSQPTASTPVGDLGTVRLALAEVPSDVGCLLLSATGATRSVTKRMPLPVGSSQFTVSVGGLPVGNVTFLGGAFTGACGAVTPDASPAWVSDPIVLSLAPGRTTPLNLSLHRNGLVNGTFTFDDGVGGSQDCTIEGDHLSCGPCVGTCSGADASLGIDDFLASLPEGDHPKPVVNQLVGTEQKRVDDSRGPFDCTSETRHVEDNIEEIAMAIASQSNVVPGLAFSSREVAQGTLGILPVRRGKLGFVIDLPIAEPQIDVPEVTIGAAEQAVAALQRRAADAVAPARLTYTTEIVSTFDQALHQLQVTAGYRDALASAGFQTLLDEGQTYTRRAIVARLIQPVFTISIADDQVERPSEYFTSSVTTEDLKAILDANNLPTVMKSVTYGRILYLGITTEEAIDSNELRVAVNAAFNGFSAGVDTKDSYQHIVSHAQVKVLALGGSQEDALAAISSGDYSQFFKPVKPTDAVPVSYKLQYMHRSRGVVAIRSALDYTVRDCTQCVLTKAQVYRTVFGPADYSCGGVFGCSEDHGFGGACDDGWVKDSVQRVQDSRDGVCGVGWLSDRPGDCSVNIHLGASAFSGVECHVAIVERQDAPGQPPVCVFSP